MFLSCIKASIKAPDRRADAAPVLTDDMERNHSSEGLSWANQQQSTGLSLASKISGPACALQDTDARWIYITPLRNTYELTLGAAKYNFNFPKTLGGS